MINLTSTSDLLQVTADTAGSIDVHCTWADKNGATITPGRTNTATITGTTITTVVASPAASTYRTVTHATIRNRHATVGAYVTVTHTDGTNALELLSVFLFPGYSLVYEEHDGWKTLNRTGMIEATSDSVASDPTIGDTCVSVLRADTVNNAATADRLMLIEELSFPIRASQAYWFRFVVVFAPNADTTGCRFVLAGTATGATTAIATNVTTLTTSTITRTEGIAGLLAPAAASLTGVAAASQCVIEGFIPSQGLPADSRVSLAFTSEVASAAVTVKAGSRVQWQRVL